MGKWATNIAWRLYSITYIFLLVFVSVLYFCNGSNCSAGFVATAATVIGAIGVEQVPKAGRILG